MPNKVMLEINLQLDQFKTVTNRGSTDVFGYLGDIGGLYGTLEIFMIIVSGYFSAKFFRQGVANTVYKYQKSKIEIDSHKHETDDISCKFKDIKISTLDLFIDPIFCFLCPLRCCRTISCRKRAYLLNKSNEKFEEDLDILNLLNKVKDSSNTVAHFHDPEYKELQ